MRTDIRIIRGKEQSTGVWAGGTTTQLAIWPPDADYAMRNFRWRMSSARVDLEESTFTALPGIRRLIMILEGRVRLVHEGRHEINLDAFDQDAFDGGWNTLSQGRCVDFNLMMAAGCEGSLRALKMDEKGDEAEKKPAARVCEVALFTSFAPEGAAEAFYCLAPRVKVLVYEGEKADGEKVAHGRKADEETAFEAELERGDFILLLQNRPVAAVMFLQEVREGPSARAFGVHASVRWQRGPGSLSSDGSPLRFGPV
ncbi:MAG: HutD family protein [Synergistaceae bacterium]|nr:HutD family protein [Synergistaceae bacterium]